MHNPRAGAVLAIDRVFIDPIRVIYNLLKAILGAVEVRGSAHADIKNQARESAVLAPADAMRLPLAHTIQGSDEAIVTTASWPRALS